MNYIQFQFTTLSVDVFRGLTVPHTHADTHTQSHTRTIYMNATHYTELAGWTCPFTSCLHQIWQEAAGFFVPHIFWLRVYRTFHTENVTLMIFTVTQTINDSI